MTEISALASSLAHVMLSENNEVSGFDHAANLAGNGNDDNTWNMSEDGPNQGFTSIPPFL